MKQKIYGSLVEIVHQPRIVPACIMAGKHIPTGNPINDCAPPVRTVHTLDTEVELIEIQEVKSRKGKEYVMRRTPNGCPYRHGITVGSDVCRQCSEYANAQGITPAGTIECMRFDCRRKRNPGDSLHHSGRFCIVASSVQLKRMKKCRNELLYNR